MYDLTMITSNAKIVRAIRALDAYDVKVGAVNNNRWFHKIDTDLLDMKHGKRCILGQLFGGYTKGTQPISTVEEYDCTLWQAFCMYTTEWKAAVTKLKVMFSGSETQDQKPKTLVLIDGVPYLLNNKSPIIQIVKENATEEDLRLLKFGLDYNQ